MKVGINLFSSNKMLGMFFLALLFCVPVMPARADWCQKAGGGVEPCSSAPSTWSDCGTFMGETVHCFSGTTSGSKGSHSSGSDSKTTQKVLISAGIGIAVVVVGYWLFKKEPSRNNPGQLSLATF